MPVEMFIDNREAIDEGDITLYIPSLEDPSLAGPGVHVFFVIGPSFARWPAYGSPGYGGEGYRNIKAKEADRMLALVERRFPGFVGSVETRIEGSPTTLVRYLRKFGGSVAGPKQSIGQDLLRRPHARTPWKGLFLAGEGTVMGTGTPAVTVSGISAANMVLRASGLREYLDQKPAPHAGAARRVDRVRIIPHGQPGNLPRSEAGRLANACQWCEKPPCVPACPSSLDIPGLLRRLAADNLEGARKRLGESAAAGAPCRDCPAPCAEACVRKGSDAGAVRIRESILLLEPIRPT
jgi:prolycopene isomerase